MAEIIDDTQSRGNSGRFPPEEGDNAELPTHITEELAEQAQQVSNNGHEVLVEIEKDDNVPYVKFIREHVQAAVAATYPVKVGNEADPYIERLLAQRKKLGEAEQSIRGQKISVDSKDEEAAELAVNLFNRFTMTWTMFFLLNFEMGLRNAGRWPEDD